MLKVYKFQIVVICQEVGDDDAVVGERLITGKDGQPVVVFGMHGLREFADTLEANVAAAQLGDSGEN